MRILKVLFLMGFFFLFAIRIEVSAAPPAAPWVESGFCAGNQLTPEDVRSQFVGSIEGDRRQLYEILVNSKSCGVGIRGKEIWGDNVTGGPVRFCPSNSIFATSVEPLGRLKNDVCCPTNKPIYVHKSGYPAVCCPTGSRDWEVVNGVRTCVTGRTNNDPVNDPDPFPQPIIDPVHVDPPDGVEFVEGIDRFSCPTDGCFTNIADEIRNNDTVNNPLTETEIAGNYNCYAFEAEKPGDEVPALICSAGDWLTEEEFNVEGGALIRVQCSMLDESERDRCFECFANNPDPLSGEPQTFVYSSLGCIDTRQNPFITRLFQVGFGLIGGFAIIMIMWGSVQRQSTDPAKIQEGWDKIKAAIASIIMIASAVPLLRYLGINLTGLLPFNIFN